MHLKLKTRVKATHVEMLDGARESLLFITLILARKKNTKIISDSLPCVQEPI